MIKKTEFSIFATIKVERMHQFLCSFHYMVVYRTDSDLIEIGDPRSKVSHSDLKFNKKKSQKF